MKKIDLKEEKEEKVSKEESKTEATLPVDSKEELKHIRRLAEGFVTSPEVDFCLKNDISEDVGVLLEGIVKEALLNRASDIHMEPRELSMIIRFRIDGSLHDMLEIPKEMEHLLIFKIKVISRLQTDEHFIPQDGRVEFKIDGAKLNVRISILPVTKGEKVVFRLLTDTGRDFTLTDLGFSAKDLEIVEKNQKKPFGMIIAAGPTGSGKTTTLYTLLKGINTREKNIVTVEDPVEYDIEGVNHVQVNTKTDLTFATGLRALLRQDPNIMMIGEIRDAETARIAINAALTGHLVLSTIHTNDAVTTIPRLTDMGIESYLAASTLTLVIAQRLARRLCQECKKARKVNKADLDELSKIRADIVKLLKVGDSVYDSVGCNACNNLGYKGRIGLYELLEVTKDVREVIAKNVTADQLLSVARKNGLVLLMEDGMIKLRTGMITLDELVKVTSLHE